MYPTVFPFVQIFFGLDDLVQKIVQLKCQPEATKGSRVIRVDTTFYPDNDEIINGAVLKNLAKVLAEHEPALFAKESGEVIDMLMKYADDAGIPTCDGNGDYDGDFSVSFAHPQ